MLKKIICHGWSNFWRQGSFSAVSVFVMLVVVSLITLIFLFQGAANFLTLSLSEKMDISVYFERESLEQEILEMKQELAKIPEVKDIEYISREQALIKFTQRHQNDPIIMESLTELGGNPLLACLNIRAWESSQYTSIFNSLSNSSFQDTIHKIDYSQKKSIIERISSLTSSINKFGIALITILIFTAVVITFNQIRIAIYNFRKEIRIMRLVGASNELIRGPFLAQGIIIGLISVFLCLLVSIPACLFLSPKLEVLSPGFNMFDYFLANFFLIFSIQLLVACGVGAFSSFIAVRKYLKI
jgi:cell division transport system permease protein